MSGLAVGCGVSPGSHCLCSCPWVPTGPLPPANPRDRRASFPSAAPSGTLPPLGQPQLWFPGLLTLQVVSAARRRGTPCPRCPVPHSSRMQGAHLRSSGDSAFRHVCCREGGGGRMIPDRLNNSAAGSQIHPEPTTTATSGTTASPEPTSAPKAKRRSAENYSSRSA